MDYNPIICDLWKLTTSTCKKNSTSPFVQSKECTTSATNLAKQLPIVS